MIRVKQLFKEKPLLLLFIFLLSIPLLLPLMHSGFFVTDDGELLLIRLTAFHEAFMHGQFPVRFLPRLYFQYGYPVSNFLYPGYLYLGELLHLIRFGFINSIKIILALSFIFSGVFSFLWLRKFLSPFASIVGAVIYLYSPYRYYDVYKRGSIGEILALTIVPVILWAIERNSLTLFIIGLSTLILSHNTLAVLFLPLLLLYYAIRNGIWKNPRAWLTLLGGLTITLLLTAFFWIPALYDLRYTIFFQTNISDLTNYFSQPDPILFTNLSIYYLVITALSLTVVFFLKKQLPPRIFVMTTVFGLISGVCLVLNVPASLILWKTLPITFIQFPFRLFSITMISFSLVAAVLTNACKTKRAYLVGVLLFVLFAAPLFFFLRPIEYSTRDDMYYATNEDSTTVRTEYLPPWVKERSYTKPKTVVEGKGVTYLNNTHGVYTFELTGTEARRIRVNILYFPGWTAYANGTMLPVQYSNAKGVMDITVPKNTKIVTLQFKETPVRTFSNALSVIGIFLLGVLFIRDGKEVYARYKK